MTDVGIVSSTNIVAIEQASLDLVNKFSNHKFNCINAVNKEKQLEFATNLGLGDNTYKLVELE